MKHRKSVVTLLLALSCWQGLHAQAPGSDVVLTLNGSGSGSATYTYNDGSGRVDNVQVQLTANMYLHPYSPQGGGLLFSSSAADFDGTIQVTAVATETEPGYSETDNFANAITYTNYTDFPAQTLFFGPAFSLADGLSLSGDAAGLTVSLLNPVNLFPQNPEPYQLFYDGTNGTLTVWVRLPEPFVYDSYPSDDEAWTIPCASAVLNNQSSLSGVVEDFTTGKPIPNATVTVFGEAMTTAADGSFSAPYVGPGPVTVAISAPGYAPYSKTEVAPPFSALRVSFRLLPLPVITFYHEAPEGVLVGHAFLSLSALTGATAYYGFYPSGFVLVSQGIVDDDSPTPWDFNIAYPVTQQQYQAAAALITQELVSPSLYTLGGLNCMAWVASVAEAAGIALPPYTDDYGVADPATFASSLQNIGDGGIFSGGLVTENASPDPPTPLDYSFSDIVSAAYTNASGVAAMMGLVYDNVNLGIVNANLTNGLFLTLTGSNLSQDVIAMNWGDGSPTQVQTTNFTHVYSPGTYQANLLVIDSGALHSYEATVVVSSSASASVNVTVTRFPPVTTPNGGLIPANPVPDFIVVQTTSLSVLPNGDAVIGFLGVPTWAYTIEATADLTGAFAPIGGATAGPDGTFQFEDAASPRQSQRFYRARYP